MLDIAYSMTEHDKAMVYSVCYIRKCCRDALTNRSYTSPNKSTLDES